MCLFHIIGLLLIAIVTIFFPVWLGFLVFGSILSFIENHPVATIIIVFVLLFIVLFANENKKY